MAGAAELGVRLTDHEGDAATTYDVDLGLRQPARQAAGRRPVRRHRRRLEKEGVEVVVGPRIARRHRQRGGDDRRQGADPAGRRGPGRHRRRAAHVARRAARRRADPHLGAGLRPRRGAQPPDRRRLGRDRRGVRLGVPRPSASRSPSSPRATACCPARTPTRPRCWRTCSRGAACTCCRSRGWPRSSGTATPSPSRSPTAAPSRARTASWRWARCPTRPGSGSRRPASARRRRVHLRRPGLAYLGPRRVRRRRLHRRPHARLGGGHAGPDRHVALPRRQGVAARPHPGLLERLHLTRRSPPSAGRSERSTPARCRPSR